jgi:hypothetical protein
VARLSDHDVRDAEHALRAEISLIVGRYIRRLLEAGKGEIQVLLEEAAKEGYDIDGTQVGRTAAANAARFYFGGLAGEAPRPAIEGSATHND